MKGSEDSGDILDSKKTSVKKMARCVGAQG